MPLAALGVVTTDATPFAGRIRRRGRLIKCEQRSAVPFVPPLADQPARFFQEPSDVAGGPTERRATSLTKHLLSRGARIERCGVRGARVAAMNAGERGSSAFAGCTRCSALGPDSESYKEGTCPSSRLRPIRGTALRPFTPARPAPPRPRAPRTRPRRPCSRSSGWRSRCRLSAAAPAAGAVPGPAGSMPPVAGGRRSTRGSTARRPSPASG